ncbi:MAG: mechanosensitive ion channel [bacterium]
MIFVLMAFFQMLGITLAADPFSKLLVQIFQFGPNLFGAALLFLIAWLLGTVIRLIVKKLLLAAKFDERLSEKVELEGKPSISLTTTISDAVYWLVFLLFLPAILDALNLYGLLEPVQVMLHNFLGFLPNLLAALLIGFIGWFVARLVQRIVTNIIAAAGGDKFCERIGLAPLSKIIGLIVYILILIPVMIAALNTLELDAVTMPASNMLNMIFTAIPPIFAAVVMIFITYIVGRIAAGFITELLKKIGFDTVLMRIGIGKQLEAGKLSPSEIVGYIALVAIMLLASFEAASMLGFHTLSELMAEFTVFGGRILLGLVIFGLSLYLANVASKAIKTGGSPQADFLALLARISIILLAGAIALQHMGIATEIISLAFGLIVGSIAVAAALAFGIGGRDFAARKLQEWTKDSAK